MEQLGLFRDLQISCQDLKVLQDDLSDFGCKQFYGQVEWRTKFYEHCDMMKWENILKKYENQVLEIWEKYVHPAISDILKQEIKEMFYKNMEKVLKLNPTEKGFAISIYRAHIVSKMIFAIQDFRNAQDKISEKFCHLHRDIEFALMLFEGNFEEFKKLHSQSLESFNILHSQSLESFNILLEQVKKIYRYRVTDIDKGIIYVFLPEIFRKSFSLNHLDGKYGKNDFLHFTYT